MNRTANSGALLFAAALAACEPPVPVRVEVFPPSHTAVATGTTVQFKARVYDSKGDLIPNADIEWRSWHPWVATVSLAGLVTVVGQGRADIRATYADLWGQARVHAELEVRGIRKLQGDGQSAPATTELPLNIVVLVHDLNGAPISDVEVAFEALSGGITRPRAATTDSLGQVSTNWLLGTPTGPQTLVVTAGEYATLFTATATEPPLSIVPLPLLRGRVAVPYREPIRVRGGVGPLFWSLESGSLPAGLVLDTTGVILGTPTETVSASFTVHVRDAEGTEVSRALRLRVCDEPSDLAPGEIHVHGTVGVHACPPFLRAGEEGDRYRVAVVRATAIEDIARESATVSVRHAHAEAPRVRLAADAPTARPVPRFPPALAAGVRVADESSLWHARLLADAARLLRELGTGAVLPDTRPNASRSAADVAIRGATPPARRLFRPYFPYRQSCEDPPPAFKPALLVGYNDHLAIYQDSAQRRRDPVRVEDARQVLDYYEEYGASTIDEYFGGVADINGDGRVNVFVSPVVPDWIAAFVWAGDFLSSEECSWSNEMELVYFHEEMFDRLENAPDSGHYQALPTMVHELKHVSSLYIRSRLGEFHPSWIEEGTAEIAAEVSARKAMEAVGSVARNAMLNRDAYPPREGIIITPENYGVLLRLARMTRSYAGPLNSVVMDPTEDHTYYGTSWHFFRFLGDSHGNAAPGADSTFFTALNDSTAPPGVAGIEAVTGRVFTDQMEDYAAAMMLNGTGAPQPERGFTTYDFPSATFELLRPEYQPEGLYPWIHTGPEPVGFHDAVYSGTLSPGGVRFHEFQSDGTGEGIDVEVSSSDETGVVRVVFVRVR